MRIAWLVALLMGSASANAALAADRVDQIKSRGYLVCDVAADHYGFGVIHPDGGDDGLDVDLCKGIAAAIFGTPDHVRFEAAATNAQFAASDADVAFDELTWTFNRELTSGLEPGPVYFFDGQAFLARATAGVTSVAQLPDASVCVEQGENFVDNLISFIEDHAPGMTIAVAGSRADEENAFFAGNCDLLTGDASEIYSAARQRGGGPYRILDERLSKEPLVPVVRAGDDRLLTIVRWSIFATMEAEELGFTADNVAKRNDWAVFGALIDPAATARLGLAPDWPRDVIEAAGSYDEIYSRNLQPGDANVGMPRGLNRLWTGGGLLYSPPLR